MCSLWYLRKNVSGSGRATVYWTSANKRDFQTLHTDERIYSGLQSCSVVKVSNFLKSSCWECRSFQETQVCLCWGTNLWSSTGIRSASAGRGSTNTAAGCSRAACWTDRRSSSALCGAWESCSAVCMYVFLCGFISARAPGELLSSARVCYNTSKWTMFLFVPHSKSRG